MTLAKARLARDAARITLAEGVDPVQAKFDAKLAKRLRLGTNFEAVARAWFEDWKGLRLGEVVKGCCRCIVNREGDDPNAAMRVLGLVGVAQRQ